MTWDTPVDTKNPNPYLRVGIEFAAIAVLYIVLSAKRILPDERAGSYFWGRALVELNPGPQFVPFGLMQVERIPREVQQFQAPGEPEKVFKGHDDEELKAGMVRPIRAVTRAPLPTENGILDAQMTIILSFAVQWLVDDVFDFIANFGTKENVEKQLRDTCESRLDEGAAATTPALYIASQTRINEDLATSVQLRFENSGIVIISVRNIAPDVSRGVSTELAKIPEARAKAVQTVATAEAEKTKLTREGEGKAAATLADLKARAEGQAEEMEKLKVPGDAILAAETARSISDKTDVIVVGGEGGMRDLMGLVKGAQAGLNPGKGGQS